MYFVMKKLKKMTVSRILLYPELIEIDRIYKLQCENNLRLIVYESIKNVKDGICSNSSSNRSKHER
jgi:hypothetical protein